MVSFKLIGWIVLNLGIYSGLLLLPAGALHWWRAWVFIGVAAIAVAAIGLSMSARNPGLLSERLKSPLQKGQPFADKLVTMLCLAAWGGLIAFIPVDRFRLHLLAQPELPISLVGLALAAVGWCTVYLAYRDNAFAAPVVKYQQERQHALAETGIYEAVRHPMYAGGVLIWLGMSLWLQSYPAALLMIFPIAAIMLRILVEERFLRRRLTGYDEYTRKVRYRLIPLLW